MASDNGKKIYDLLLIEEYEKPGGGTGTAFHQAGVGWPLVEGPGVSIKMNFDISRGDRLILKERKPRGGNGGGL